MLILLGSCGKMEEPVFNNIGNVKLGKLGLATTTMSFDMEYFNPNNSRAKLTAAAGEAWLDSNYLGHFHVDTLVIIPPKSNFTVPVKLDMDMQKLLTYSLSDFRNKKDVLVTIKGTARVGKSGFYRKLPLDYEGRKNLSEIFKQ
jgi:LEA14-like dessication related protein